MTRAAKTDVQTSC